MSNSRLSFRHWRISNKLLVVMLALSLLPLLLAAWIINASSVDALTRQTEANMTRLGNSMALRISSALADSQGLLSMAANDPAVAAAVTGGPAPGNVDALNTAVANLLQANPRIDTVGIYDATGTAMAHTDPATLGRSVAERDFIGAALAGETFTSSFRRDLVNDQPGINLSAPVRAGDAVVGAVAIHLDERFISDVFAQTLGADSGAAAAQAQEAIDVYLVDPHGIVMSQLRGQDWLGRSLGALSPEMETRIAQASPLGGDCPADNPQCPPAERIARQPAPMPSVQALGDAVAQALASGQPASLRYCHPDDPAAPASDASCRGQFFVAAFAPVAVPAAHAAGSPGQDTSLFSVVVDLPEASFLGSVDRQRALGLTIAGIMAVVAVLASWLLARTLSRPISALASTAGEVAADQPFVPDRIADVTGQGDEVGGLARAFSRMVLALQARLAELGAIYDIGRTISASVDLDQTVATLAESLRGAIPYDAAEITLYDQAQGTMALVHAVGGEALELPRAYPPDQGLVGQLAQRRGPMLAADLASLPAAQTEGFAQRTWRSLRPRSYLGVPLLVRGKLVGAIELVSQAPDAFTADHQRVVETIAGQAAVSIQNAQEVQAREAQLKAQIQELRIEIDEIKRSKQVEEIVDTDYFQRLSAQAKRMRSGRSSGDAD